MSVISPTPEHLVDGYLPLLVEGLPTTQTETSIPKGMLEVTPTGTLTHRMMQKPDHARIAWQNFTIELKYRMIETLFGWNIRGLYTVEYSRSD